MLISYSQGTFDASDFVKYLNLTGQGNALFSELIKIREAVKKAESLNLKISDDDLQTFVDNFRISLGLHSAEDTLQFLSRAGLTVEDLEQYCHSTLITEALKDHLANDAKIEAYYINNRTEFDLARISIVAVETENLANEILMQVNEDGEDFHALARMHSIDPETKYAGGYVGLVSRKTFPAEVSAKVFNAQTDDMLGPFKDGENYQLILVQELIKPDFGDRLKAVIRQKIFDEWGTQFIEAGVECDSDNI